jgi:hypothetical protein
MKHAFWGIWVLLLVLTLTFTFASNLQADIISIDFANLSVGDAVSDQYSSDGIIFGDSLDQPIAPGQIVTGGYNSDNALGADSMDPGIFILFTTPVYSISTFVLEGPTPEPEQEEEPQPEPEPEEEQEPVDQPEEEEPEETPPEEEENTVYLRVFGVDNYNLLDDGNTSVSAVGSWEELSFSSVLPIAAVQLWGTQGFRLDDITISNTSETVPEPATLFMLGLGIIGLAGMRRKFKK